ncbi:MAG: hypothetical protein QXS19_09485 [Candidatus Methanomethylicia archaeon]
MSIPGNELANVSDNRIGIPVLTATFPVGSSGVYPFNEVIIRPLNFAGFIQYIRNYPQASDQYTTFLYTYNVVRNYVTHLDMLFLPDIYYVFFLFWGISVNKNMEFTITHACDSCGHKNSLSITSADISFKSFDSPIFEVSISGNTYQCKFPTGEKIRTHLPRLMASGKNYDLDVAFLILSFIEFERRGAEIENLVANASHDDIVNLLTVLADYIHPPANEYVYACSKCKSRNYVNYYNHLATDFFRVFMENRGSA